MGKLNSLRQKIQKEAIDELEKEFNKIKLKTEILK